MESPRQISEQEREALVVARQNLVVAEGRTYDHISSMFRWLLAALFTANGGAIATLLARNDATVPLTAMEFFAAGMVLSLLMGVASTLTAIRVSGKLNGARAIAEQMLNDGVDRGDQLQAKLRAFQTSWRDWFPAYTGAASLACLAFGIFAVVP